MAGANAGGHGGHAGSGSTSGSTTGTASTTTTSKNIDPTQGSYRKHRTVKAWGTPQVKAGVTSRKGGPTGTTKGRHVSPKRNAKGKRGIQGRKYTSTEQMFIRGIVE